jgi:ribosomal protein L12E/L44/L45/RPP1/RPP2
MPTYEVKSRTTKPTVTSTVTADTREEAVHMTVADAEEGDSVEVMQVTEMVSDASAPAPKAAPAAKK